ncbi:hypothetical protein P7C73_g5395, partial [Tremellales sp. Uapishka_1]
MPLYKLTSKRLEKRAREDELGITALKSKMREMGEEVGSSGSDSGSEGSEEDEGEDEDEDEESDGDSGNEERLDSEDDSSDEDSEDEAEEERAGEQVGYKRKRDLRDEAGAEEVDEEVDGEEDDEAVEFTMTIEEALTAPLYPLAAPSASGSEDEETTPKAVYHACVLCPGKLLKNATMVAKHLESKSHERSGKRYARRIAEVDTKPLTSDDPRDVVDDILDEMEAKPKPAVVAKKLKVDRAEQQNEKEGKETVQPTKTTEKKAERGISGSVKEKENSRSWKSPKEVRREQKAKDGTELEGKALNRKARRALLGKEGAKGNVKTT